MNGSYDLKQVAAALKNAQRDIERAAWFVPSDRFGIARRDQPEMRLVQQLRDDPTAHLSVEGPAGAGKTSLIVYALGKLHAFNHVSIVIRIPVGEPAITFDKLQTALLAELSDLFDGVDPTSELRTIANNVDLDDLARAAAEKTTVAQPGSTTAVQGGVRAGISATVTRTIAAETRAYQSAVTALARSKALNDLLGTLTKAGARLTVVIDDTEHFATANDPIAQPDDVRALFSAVSQLSTFELQIVLSVHPRFRDVDKAADVLTRSSFIAVPVAQLPVDESKGLLQILDKRLTTTKLEVTAKEVFSANALAALEAVYHAYGRHDLRYVLRIAQAACAFAAENSQVVDSRPLVRKAHVNAALEADQAPTG